MTPLERYQIDLEQAHFIADEAQLNAVKKTQQLYESLLSRPSGSSSLINRFFSKPAAPVPWLYLLGGTGRGKTYLVDCFYECLPFKEKHRIHFHRFMRETHKQLQQAKGIPNPLDHIVGEFAKKIRVLCLDEFHVSDIGDAMIMSGLLQAMLNQGITLVTSSNTAINNLYRNGLQRERFLPAIELLKHHAIEVDLGNGQDYRFHLQKQNESYHIVKKGENDHTRLERIMTQISPCTPKHGRSIEINDRDIAYIALADDVVWFDFDALCNTPRSAADYLNIAEMFHTVIISGVRVMKESNDDVATRFIHLIDALYDHQVKLVVSASSEMQQLYQGRLLTEPFKRTVSRLNEMASERYMSLPHLPTRQAAAQTS